MQDIEGQHYAVATNVTVANTKKCPILVFFKEDCTIDEIVFSFVPLNPLATISRCAVLVAVLTQYLRSASTQFQH